MYSSESGYSVAPNVRATLDADGGILLDVDSGIYYGLNRTGGLIWSMLCKGEALVKIVDSLTDNCGANHGQIERDVHSFVGLLKRKGIILEKEKA